MNIIDFLRRLSPRTLLLALGAASALMLSAALVAQYGFRLYPCELCMAQRYPYAAIMLLSLAGLFPKVPPRTLYYLACACAGLLLIDSGIAFYHSGVEAGLFPAPSACASNTKGGETIEELRRAIMEAPLVTCDQPMTHILGLSLAAWNALAALFFAMAAVFCLRKKS